MQLVIPSNWALSKKKNDNMDDKFKFNEAKLTRQFLISKLFMFNITESFEVKIIY